MKDINREFFESYENYFNNNIDETQFKPIRVKYGVYEQRDGKYMIRTKVPAGLLNKNQFETILNLSIHYGNGIIDFTTREDIQIHNLNLIDSKDILSKLSEKNILTIGAGGNSVRNIMINPNIELNDNGVKIVNDLLTLSNYTLNCNKDILPRKFKIYFSDDINDRLAYFNDLSFIKTKEGYDVLAGGGLGNAPLKSIKIDENIDEKDIIKVFKAVYQIFLDHGNRTNKNRARLRFILKQFGEEKFILEYKNNLSNIDNIEFNKIKFNETIYNSSLNIYPSNGQINSKEILKIIKDKKYLIKLNNEKGFKIYFDENDKNNINDLLDKFNGKNIIEKTVACKGAATCKLGFTDSQALVKELINQFKNLDEIKLPKIFISGCPNSCARHQIADLGFYGGVKRVEKKLMPIYSMVVNLDNSLSKEIGKIPTKNLPNFLIDLNSKVKELSLVEFVNKADQINQLLDKHNIIDESNENIFMDFGKNEPFSLKGRAPGECSVGVLDIIKYEINNAIKENSYQNMINSMRAMLILNGFDNNDENLILINFKKHYLDKGYFSKDHYEIINNLIDQKIKLSNQSIADIIKKVYDIFNSLSPNLKITIEKNYEPEVKMEKIDKKHYELDITEDVCPYTFINSKVRIDDLEIGEILDIKIADDEACVNVPASLERDGHKILCKTKLEDGNYLVSVKKGE